MSNNKLKQDDFFGQVLKILSVLLLPLLLLGALLLRSTQGALAKPPGQQGSEDQMPNQVCLPLVFRNFCKACNTDFEEGSFSCWEHDGELEQSAQSQVVYEGTYAALLGSPYYLCQSGVPIGSAWMRQFFPVPSCPNPVLSFKYRIWSNDRLRGEESDSFDVYINDTRILRDGNRDWSRGTCHAPAWNSGWKEFTYDLSNYQGQCILVSFYNASRGLRWFNTWTYVDDVKVTCEEP